MEKQLQVGVLCSTVLHGLRTNSQSVSIFFSSVFYFTYQVSQNAGLPNYRQEPTRTDKSRQEPTRGILYINSLICSLKKNVL